MRGTSEHPFDGIEPLHIIGSLSFLVLALLWGGYSVHVKMLMGLLLVFSPFILLLVLVKISSNAMEADVDEALSQLKTELGRNNLRIDSLEYKVELLYDRNEQIQQIMKEKAEKSFRIKRKQKSAPLRPGNNPFKDILKYTD